MNVSNNIAVSIENPSLNNKEISNKEINKKPPIETQSVVSPENELERYQTVNETEKTIGSIINTTA